MSDSRYVPLVAVLASCVVLAACDQGRVSDPDFVRVETPGLLSLCELQPELVTTAMIGPDGGSISGGGMSMTVPAGAVTEPTHFTLRVPLSRYAEVEIRANDEHHWQFHRPVVIRMAYDRCGTPAGELSAWHIDPDTKKLLEEMGGVDDELTRTVSFSTMHLSGYAIAN